ncbi:MAG: NAD-dependent epimerase [Bacteroidetes bacterium]|nr:NAD-dependent epimerase [Bacteroidota bacterium]
MKVLITGTAGFIGFHLAKKLLEQGYTVIGLDNINDYYDVNLKYGRLRETGIEKKLIKYNSRVQSTNFKNYSFYQLNLEDNANVQNLFQKEKIEYVIHLAAQAGVRYSLENPHAYINSNIQGFINILEACRNFNIKHLIYASSSSVYGLNEKMPFSTKDNVDHPISLYAATKKSSELMAHSYSYLFKIPTTGLRFFTVYGPWGRPDMALFLFTKAIIENRAIDVYNYGNMLRDFTFIDDIVNGISKVIENPPRGNSKWKGLKPDPSCSPAPYKIFNIGNNSPVKLMDFINTLETSLGQKAKLNLLPMQPGDVKATFADVSGLIEEMDYRPDTPIQKGINEFVKWYRGYYKV